MPARSSISRNMLFSSWPTNKRHDPIGPYLLEFPDLVGGTPLALQRKYAEIKHVRVAPGILRHNLDALYAVGEFIDALDDREPAIAPLCHALERARIVDAADPDRQVRLLL